MSVTKYIKLGDLEVYKLAVDLSRDGWKIYESLDWKDKKIMGDQCIRSIDSVGANIAEGYGRFHFLDKNKFYYNARGSLLEVKHWVFILKTRSKISEKTFNDTLAKLNNLHLKLNNFIGTTYKAKQSSLSN